MKRLSVILVVVAFCGCQNTPTLVRCEPKTYTPTPLRSQTAVATLKNKRYQRDTVGQFGYNLHHIDGVGVWSMVQRDQTALLNPGRHVINIEAFGPSGGGRKTVSFEAKTGFIYEADGRIGTDRIEIWIQVANTAEVVSDVAVIPLGGPSLPIFWGK